MSLRAEHDLPRDLTEDLAIPFDDYLEPYSMEAIEVPATVAATLRAVLLAVAEGDIDYDKAEIVRVLSSFEHVCPDEVSNLLSILEVGHPSEIEDLDLLLDELVSRLEES